MENNLNYSKLKIIPVYLGTNCNFECDYCDRETIKEHIGYTALDIKDVPKIVEFIKTVNPDGNLYMMSFFGGEPFVFVKVMDEIIKQISELHPNLKFLIQTNGSLILKNQDFIQHWNKKLHISISYDFAFQELNRTVFDIDATLAFIKPLVNHIQMQSVLPVNRSDCFTVDKMAAIVSLFERHQMDRLSLIPLRHIRGPGRFRTFINDVPINDLFPKLLQMIQVLHLYNIQVVLDGMTSSIEKSYFADHKQLVIAPDGYLYPEFDFIEYKVEGARIGEWKDNIVVHPVSDDSHLIHERCQGCEARNKCGIKYLYKLWADKPDENCLKINAMYEILIRHIFALRESKNLLDLVGIK